MAFSRRDPAITVTIDDIAFGGDGVGRWQHEVTFVPFTIEGETVQATVVERRRRFQRAALVRVLKPSPHRADPPCPYFGRCGGCAYQHMAYPHQLEVKRAQVAQALRRIGQFREVEVAPAVPSPQPFGYRNRITVHAEDGKLGFYELRSHTLLDIVRCPLASEAVNAKLAELRRRGLPPGAHRTLREGAGTTFEQVNDGVARLLLEYVGRHLCGDSLVDAYCGSGFFAHAFAPRLRMVAGIEWSEPAVASARRNACANETYHLGDVAALLGEVLRATKPDSLLLDPPAEGLGPEVIEQTLAQPPARIVYVSCNPATLARDLSRLAPGYRLLEVQPFDMFPQTAEVEAAAVLGKR
ncbi:MAG: class I SAM-dependent RNA methyltransferase [Verrucomicrobia bacterium]|nr:class I SAM-dependent RNA methyltransferase [Verrucomicrobiota bacterium]